MSSCNLCNLSVQRQAKDVVQCEKCKHLYHITCEKVSNESKAKPYLCKMCVKPAAMDSCLTNLKQSTADSSPTFTAITSIKSDIQNIQLQQSSFLQLLKEQQQSFNDSFKQLSNKIDQLAKIEETVNKHDHEIVTLKAENAELSKQLQLCNSRLDILEKFCNLSTLQIFGVPFNTEENLGVVADQIFKSIGFTAVDKSYIKHIHRTYSKTFPKPITVEFYNKFDKEAILQLVKGRKNTIPSDVNFNNPSKILIMDYLPGWKKKLLAVAKDKLLKTNTNNNQYKYVWAKHGNIYCRKSDDDVLVKISSQLDLDKLI